MNFDNSQNKTDVILNSLAEGVFTVDSDWRITSFNRAAEEITGIPAEEAIGRHCWEVFRANICEKDCPLRNTMKEGTQNISRTIYIIDAEGNRIPVSISTALLRDEKGNVIGGVETFRDMSLVTELKRKVEEKSEFFDIISRNHEMRKLFELVSRIAPANSTVLIEGESGTGKELFARAIHALCARRDKPLVTVNCAALPETLLESELFGYKAGAFTGAARDKPGRFALASGGTIFLDEIGDIPPGLQVKLLRVLQEKTYEPLGGVKTLKADVRVVAATNQNLEELVNRGKFRSDLYYRINVIRLSIPPLSERKEDIPLLAEHFINRFNRLYEKKISGLSPETLEILMKYDFPGNVRELENIMERACILCREDEIHPRHLPEYLQPEMKTARPESLRELEAEHIRNALKRNRWSRAATARELGIHKSTLYRKIKSLGVILPSKDGRSRE